MLFWICQLFIFFLSVNLYHILSEYRSFFSYRTQSNIWEHFFRQIFRLLGFCNYEFWYKNLLFFVHNFAVFCCFNISSHCHIIEKSNWKFYRILIIEHNCYCFHNIFVFIAYDIDTVFLQNLVEILIFACVCSLFLLSMPNIGLKKSQPPTLDILITLQIDVGLQINVLLTFNN